jgi:choline dehydrogenase-like flavoprotein
MSDIWDYIVVGAGSAGCVMAERLSADGKFAGAGARSGRRERFSFWVTLPKGVAKLVHQPGAHLGLSGQLSRARKAGRWARSGSAARDWAVPRRSTA